MRRSAGVFVILLAVAGPVLAQETVPTPSPATETPGGSPPASDDGPTVSAPPVLAAPAAGSVRLRRGAVSDKPVALARGAASTVTSYVKGKSLTVKTPGGMLVKYRVAKNASVPDDLAAGRTVLVETKVVKKRRYASRVTYAESRVVITNVD